jgi:hypothetical protein
MENKASTGVIVAINAPKAHEFLFSNFENNSILQILI